MKKKKFLLGALTFFLILFAGLYVMQNIYSLRGNQIRKVFLEGHQFRMEFVTEKGRMQRGLGGRKGLCLDCGMWFAFSSKGRYSFWMKDMNFPLDIVWLADGRVIYLQKGVNEKEQGILTPLVEADNVLEFNAGTCDKYGIKIGSELLLK